MDNQTLIDFWDKAFSLSEEEKAQLQNQQAEDWKELAPSQKLFQAVCSLGQRKKVLDFGCGNAWASIIAAKSGCTNVTAVDAAPGAVQAAELFMKLYGVRTMFTLPAHRPTGCKASPTARMTDCFAPTCWT